MNAFARRIHARPVRRRVLVLPAIYIGATALVIAVRHLSHP